MLVLTALGAVPGATAAGKEFQDETLRYVITYKWGLLTKDTGDATLTLRRTPSGQYDVKLTGRTRTWADRLYKVRDTLHAVIDRQDLRPVSYTKSAHEGGNYSRDHIVYSYPGGRDVAASCHRYKLKKDGTESERDKQLAATGPTYDMLSVFYYLRVLPYAELTGKKEVKLSMFSGMAAETVSIRCLGLETVTLRNKQKRQAWHLTFRFTTDGRKKSSDDIDAWISADDARIPLQLVGSLSLGKVTCHYLGD